MMYSGLITTLIIITLTYIVLGRLLIRNTPNLPVKVILGDNEKSTRELLVLLKLLVRFIKLTRVNGKIGSGLCDILWIMTTLGLINSDESLYVKIKMAARFDPNGERAFYWPFGEVEPRIKALNTWIDELKMENK